MEKDIPYIAFESMMARYERHTKRLIIALIIAIALMFFSNAAWLIAWCQYDYSSATSSVQVDAKDGVANYIGNDGDITNGEDTKDSKDEIENKEE